jgi:hypothetical protein
MSNLSVCIFLDVHNVCHTFNCGIALWLLFLDFSNFVVVYDAIRKYSRLLHCPEHNGNNNSINSISSFQQRSAAPQYVKGLWGEGAYMENIDLYYSVTNT